MISQLVKNKTVGFTASAADLFHAGHVAMLKEAKEHCDYLIFALQTDPSTDRSSKNKPIQSIVERQIQLQGCKYVDEILVYHTEKDLEDLLLTLDIDVRFLGEEYKDNEFTGKKICKDRGILLHFNKRDHSFSTSELRERVFVQESIKKASGEMESYLPLLIDLVKIIAANENTNITTIGNMIRDVCFNLDLNVPLDDILAKNSGVDAIRSLVNINRTENDQNLGNAVDNVVEIIAQKL